MILKRQEDEAIRSQKVFEERKKEIEKYKNLTSDEKKNIRKQQAITSLNIASAVATVPLGLSLATGAVKLTTAGVGLLASKNIAKTAAITSADIASASSVTSKALAKGLGPKSLFIGGAEVSGPGSSYTIGRTAVKASETGATFNMNAQALKGISGLTRSGYVAEGVEVGSGITYLPESASVLNNVLDVEAATAGLDLSNKIAISGRNVAKVGAVAGITAGSLKISAAKGLGSIVESELESEINNVSDIIESQNVEPIDERTSLERDLDDLGINREGLGSKEIEKILNRLDPETAQEVLDSFDSTLPSVYNKFIDSEIGSFDPFLKPSDLMVIDPSGRVVTGKEFKTSNFNFIDPFHLGQDFGLALGQQIPVMSKLLRSGSSRTKSLLLSSLMSSDGSPNEAFISKKLNNFLLSSKYIQDPDASNKSYDIIASVYDGKFKTDAYYKDGFVSLVDETGSLRQYKGSQGTFKIGSAVIENPTTIGAYIGPASSNNTLPRLVGTGSNNFLDTLAFLHDISYDEEGYFSIIADQQLVSRVRQNMDKFTGSDYYLAKFVDNWFSTVSPLLSKITNQDESNKLYQNLLYSDPNDLFSFVVGPFNSYALDVNLVRAQRLTRNASRSKFYAGLKDGLDKAYQYALVNAGFPTNGESNSIIIASFNDIPISIN